MVNSNFDESRVLGTYTIIVIGGGLGGLGATCQLTLKLKKKNFALYSQNFNAN